MRVASIRTHLADSRGQNLVEFALSAFLLIMLILGVFEFCRIMLVVTTIGNAAHAAVRNGIVNGAAFGSVARATATGWVAAAPMNTALLSVSPSTGSGAPGTQVTVTVSYRYDPLVGYFPLGGMQLSSSSSGVIVH